MRLLIIRPEPGASASAMRAADAGMEAIKLPFFEVHARDWSAPDTARYDALLLTSANAVRHAGDGLQAYQHLPVHAVGARTANVAKDAGLNIVSIGSTNADEAVTAANDAGHKRLLWLAGEDHRPIKPHTGLMIDIVICYASMACRLPDDAKAQIMAADAVALHSARAAQLFGETVAAFDLARSSMTIAAFSPAIAAAAGSGWRNIVIADMANDSALLSTLKSLDTQVSNAEKKL
jgi:uroporphyrinogen-III synthase